MLSPELTLPHRGLAKFAEIRHNSVVVTVLQQLDLLRSEIMTRSKWSAVLLLSLGAMALCNAQTRRPESWVQTGALGPAPARLSEGLPLSDQEGQGRWLRYEPMTDDFEGTVLDSEKWWPRNPGWLGRGL